LPCDRSLVGGSPLRLLRFHVVSRAFRVSSSSKALGTHLYPLCTRVSLRAQRRASFSQVQADRPRAVGAHRAAHGGRRPRAEPAPLPPPRHLLLPPGPRGHLRRRRGERTRGERGERHQTQLRNLGRVTHFPCAPWHSPHSTSVRAKPVTLCSPSLSSLNTLRHGTRRAQRRPSTCTRGAGLRAPPCTWATWCPS